MEDPAFLTVGVTSPISTCRAAHVTYVRSTVAHARISAIDTDEARTAPGVVAVFTAADIDVAPAPPAFPLVDAAYARPFLAQGVVRFVGEPVAVIVSETREQGADAAELVFVDYDPLPVVVDPEVAARDDVLLFPEIGTNVVLASTAPEDDPFAECDVVVEARIVNQKMAVAPIEPRACAAVWDGKRLTQWACSQGAQKCAQQLVGALGIRSTTSGIVPDVGSAPVASTATTPKRSWSVGSRRLERPMRWVESRTEHMLAFSHGRGQVQYAALGGTRDGRILAYKLHVIQDCGAYASSFGPLMPRMTGTMASGCYLIPRLDYSSQSVLTNTTPVGAFRGAGRPEAAAAIER
jgi:carbon-monoxide dehydrogenase large subunit